MWDALTGIFVSKMCFTEVTGQIQMTLGPTWIAEHSRRVRGIGKQTALLGCRALSWRRMVVPGGGGRFGHGNVS